MFNEIEVGLTDSESEIRKLSRTLLADDRGTVAVQPDERHRWQDEELVSSISSQLSSEDLEELSRQIRERGPVSSYSEVRQRVFGQE